LCGIIGCTLKEGFAAPLIRQALKRLEYRGYDSAGIATVGNEAICIKKDSGKIDEIHARLNFDNMTGTTGIGHTRWATHGAPTKENAHPHLDCKSSVAVVHNGVIENFLELKEELTGKGHIFMSRTDTEVISHMIEEKLKENNDICTAVEEAVKRLEGSYAVAVISAKEPDRIVCTRNESPLVIGVSELGAFCSSDIPAILPFSNRMIVLEDGDIALLTPNSYEVRNVSSNMPVTRVPQVIEWAVETAEKQGYSHFMLKEIHEQPLALKNALRLQDQYLDLLATLLDRGRDIFLVAAGTSYHACLVVSYAFSKLARLTTYPVISSEFIENYGESVNVDSVVLAVSQSGETYDTLKAVNHARMKGATILGITNTVGSTLTRISRAYVVQQSGPERGVAATKTFTAQSMVLTQLALKLAKIRGKISQDEVDELKAAMLAIPSSIRTILDTKEAQVRRLAEKYANKSLFIFLGRGISTATALEGRLKLLEIAYIPSLAYSAGESKHGPISMIEEGVPVVFISPNDETKKDVIGNIMEMKARGARIITVCEEGDGKAKNLSDDIIEMPKGIPEILSPTPYIIPLQLLAYYSTIRKGLDPDKPRNLAKCVTVP